MRRHHAAAFCSIFDGVTVKTVLLDEAHALLEQQAGGAAGGGGPAGRPSLRDLYVRIDRPTQRRRDRTP